jgi:hypothetical protein
MSEGENKAQIKPASGAAPGGENTVGKVIPQTSPAPAGGKSQPDKAWYEQVWDGYKKAALDDVNADLGEPPDPLNKPKGGWEILGASVFGAAKDAADNAGGGGGGRMSAKATRPKPQKSKTEPDKKPKSEEKPEAVSAGGKKANSGGGGYSKAKVKQEPHEDCGRKQPYSDKKGVKGTGLEKDHTPSSKAIQAAAMKEMEPLIGKSLTKGQAEKIAHAVSEKAPTIAIPPDVHRAGQTWGSGKNTPTQIAQDAGDLNGAAKRNTEKISEIMADKKHGCNDAYNKAAEEITSMDWNKFVKDTIADKLPKPKT